MAVSATNLITGPGALYDAPFGTAEGDDANVGDAPVAPWADLGGTQDGVTLTVSREFFELEIDQVIDVPARRATKRDTSVKTNLAEITLENLALALAQPGASIDSGAGFKALELEEDDPGAEPNYRALLFRGRAPGGFRRHVIIRKALSTGEIETAYKKGDQTLYPVTFSAHWVSPSIRPVRWVDGVEPTP